MSEIFKPGQSCCPSGWFQYDLVGNPEVMFSSDKALKKEKNRKLTGPSLVKS